MSSINTSPFIEAQGADILGHSSDYTTLARQYRELEHQFLGTEVALSDKGNECDELRALVLRLTRDLEAKYSEDAESPDTCTETEQGWAYELQGLQTQNEVLRTRASRNIREMSVMAERINQLECHNQKLTAQMSCQERIQITFNKAQQPTELAEACHQCRLHTTSPQDTSELRQDQLDELVNNADVEMTEQQGARNFSTSREPPCTLNLQKEMGDADTITSQEVDDGSGSVWRPLQELPAWSRDVLVRQNLLLASYRAKCEEILQSPSAVQATAAYGRTNDSRQTTIYCKDVADQLVQIKQENRKLMDAYRDLVAHVRQLHMKRPMSDTSPRSFLARARKNMDFLTT